MSIYRFPPEGPRFMHGPFVAYVPAVRGSTWYPFHSEFDVHQDEAIIENLNENGECCVHFPQLQDMDEEPQNASDCWTVFGAFERLPEETELVSDFGRGIQNRDPKLGIRLPDLSYAWQSRSPCEIHQGDLLLIRDIVYRVRNLEQDEQYFATCDLHRMDDLETGFLQSLILAAANPNRPEHQT